MCSQRNNADNSIEILKSNKVGLNSKESYVVVRNRINFLRILGCAPEWELMTATASEDDGRILVCRNQLRLVEAALRLSAELGINPKVEKDRLKREYVKICSICQEIGQDDADFNKELQGLLDKFFVYFDNYQDLDYRDSNEMIELYETLATDDKGSDVYLSDGVWLRSDGSVHDESR